MNHFEKSKTGHIHKKKFIMHANILLAIHWSTVCNPI